MAMRPIRELPVEDCRRLRVIFSDIDDTLTHDGRIPAPAFAALWQAHDAGLAVVPVTGRPAGWCDHLARMWPVPAVVGENGALAFALRDGRMHRIWADRPADAGERLLRIRDQVLREVPGSRIAADQAYRVYDLAVDICEEVSPLSDEAIDRIVAIFEAHGATAKVSSIHVNGWFGAFDKLTMCQRASVELLGGALDPHTATFVGDSPNDEPMFRFFPLAVGVANVRRFLPRLTHPPAYVTTGEGGYGFAELIDHILRSR